MNFIGKNVLVPVDKASTIIYHGCMKKNRLSLETIEKIKLLRSKGFSLPELSKEFGIPKTTLFHHIRDVKILPEFLSSWRGKWGGSIKLKLQKEKRALEEGKQLVETLSKKEKMLFISALYWAEGSKKDFGLSNTDPALIKVFIEGLQEVFGIVKQDFRVSVRIYEDLDREKCLDFWSGVTGVPKEAFISVNVLQGKKLGKLEYGMCRVRIVKGGDLLKKIVGINKAVFTNLSL